MMRDGPRQLQRHVRQPGRCPSPPPAYDEPDVRAEHQTGDAHVPWNAHGDPTRTGGQSEPYGAAHEGSRVQPYPGEHAHGVPTVAAPRTAAPVPGCQAANAAANDSAA